MSVGIGAAETAVSSACVVFNIKVLGNNTAHTGETRLIAAAGAVLFFYNCVVSADTAVDILHVEGAV